MKFSKYVGIGTHKKVKSDVNMTLEKRNVAHQKELRLRVPYPLPVSLGRCNGERCTNSLHLCLSWARACVVAIHSAMLSVHFCFCLPRLLSPWTIPWSVVLDRPLE